MANALSTYGYTCPNCKQMASTYLIADGRRVTFCHVKVPGTPRTPTKYRTCDVSLFEAERSKAFTPIEIVAAMRRAS